MPNKIKMKDLIPRDQEVFQIPIDPRTERKADLVGIHRGRQEIGFFTTIGKESITAGVRTNRGWKYYPVPVYTKKIKEGDEEREVKEKADYVLFNVTLDEHTKARVSDKIITVAEFRDANNQKIVTSRVETK